jgi:hypothetical protein
MRRHERDEIAREIAGGLVGAGEMAIDGSGQRRRRPRIPRARHGSGSNIHELSAKPPTAP